MGVSPKIGRLTIYGGELTSMDFGDLDLIFKVTPAL